MVDDYTLGHAIRVVNLGDRARRPPSPEETFEVGLGVFLDGDERHFASK